MTASKKPTIVVLGSINMDVVGIASRLPDPGETIAGERFFTAPGGKGANQAVVAARLGARVKMIGRVGKDTFGPILLDGLSSYGIDVASVTQDENNSSGVAIILLDASKQNRILAIYGANTACGQAEVEAAKRALADADVLMLQNEIPTDVSLAAAQYARSKGVRVIWDPAPAIALPSDVFKAADVLTPNQTEAQFLTGIEIGDEKSAHEAARALLRLGVSVAVVKLGEMGVCYALASDSGYVPAFKVDVIDTTAAGDAFGGGLALALAEGKGMAEAVRFGAACGAMAVTRPGAQPSMPMREEVEALLAGR